MRWLLLVLLFFQGCSVAAVNTIVSPSESLYYEATRYYEDENFVVAIAKYKKFIDENPRSALVISSQLNLGMSYYHNKDLKQAHTILKSITIKDENVKKYVDRVIQICVDLLGDELTVVAAKAEGSINIEVIDVYADNFGSVVLTGKIDKVSSVFVEGAKAAINDDNTFTSTVSWKKGKSILIIAKEDSGLESKLEYFPDSEPPDDPESLTVVNTTSNSAEIEWDENDEEDIKGYKLYYRLKGGSEIEIREIIEDTDYEIVGLGNLVQGANKTFEFYIKAVDKLNNISDSSDIAEGTLP